MEKTKLKIRFFTIVDYEKEQKWLEEMHRQGWRPKRFTAPCFYLFEQCAPEEMIYQLEFNEKELTVDGEYLQLIRDCGWTYLFACLGWRYFRKPRRGSEGACELFTDDASKLEQVRRIFRRRMIPLLVIFTCIILPNLFGNLTARDTPVLFWIYVAMLVLYLILFAICGHGFWVLYRKYGKRP